MKQFIINEDVRNAIINIIADSVNKSVTFKELNQLLGILQQLPEYQQPKEETIKDGN